MEEAVKEGIILKEKDTELLRNCKDTVPVVAGNELTGHTKSSFLVYMLPQEGQKRHLQEKGTNLRLPQ